MLNQHSEKACKKRDFLKLKRYGRAYYLQTNAERTVFHVSDGNGYPFLLAKKIEVNVATRAAGNAAARDTPKI
ncbi:hypothetical protein [Chryseobacterium takakiae]|uniref:hypothetical protein n=1 Tax=Chryseobacterium takakiae TaxID=1302685 RepID=UPI0011608D3D|nr:hypothetical protein [Chryseobacterium takakiae]